MTIFMLLVALWDLVDSNSFYDILFWFDDHLGMYRLGDIKVDRRTKSKETGFASTPEMWGKGNPYFNVLSSSQLNLTSSWRPLNTFIWGYSTKRISQYYISFFFFANGPLQSTPIECSFTEAKSGDRSFPSFILKMDGVLTTTSAFIWHIMDP